MSHPFNKPEKRMYCMRNDPNALIKITSRFLKLLESKDYAHLEWDIDSRVSFRRNKKLKVETLTITFATLTAENEND